MILNKKTIYTKDLANKQIKVTREFDASVQDVWDAWTKPEILDLWWAPKPWKAVTTSMDFKEGGTWFYYMQGPEGERHYCRVDYTSKKPITSFGGQDAFCDEKGNINNEFPGMHWANDFAPVGEGTKVNVLITFKSEEDLEKIIEMGFKEGFEAAHGNLDEIFAAKKK